MSGSRRKAVQRYHDRVAHQYDDIYDDAYWRWHDAVTWGYLKPHLPRDLSLPIVDLGCGTGKWGLKLAQSGYHVTLVDISPKMIDAAQASVQELGLADKVSYLQADLIDLRGLPRDQYALAVAMGEPICSADPPARAVKEIHRILRPGGKLVATFDNSLNALEHYLEKGEVGELEAFLRTGKTHWLTRDGQERFSLQTFTLTQLAKMLKLAKFNLVEVLGKTVLPVRRYRSLLEQPLQFRRLLGMERKLARDPDAVCRAPHLQIAAAKVS